MTLTEQFWTMFAMIGGGAGVGAFTDTWRTWRVRPFVLVAIGAGILQGMMIFWLLYQVNEGIIRIYVFLALGCGFAFYQALLRPFYLECLSFVTRTFRGIIKVVGVLLRPFRRLILFVYRLVKKGITYIAWMPVNKGWRALRAYVRKILRK
ncbi:spore cortex biosynthesis protein YabQ [Salimicrobium halophilum]|uniref:Spore cortex biosynthesis protein YabQ n=1 Tax=Salimicrobium halophilum TaxID=86666 RepID=A0A1G8W2R0_9BACI|nr:spore cortex biosynthesis protein YabQ [Salimicrobium halophilum]SDJ72598.1 spore cortex biosynthesis protein YabQ [Salimicrobium halophilum]